MAVDMKNLYDFMKYSFISAIIVLAIYPLLHELGHAVCALLVGAQIKSFSILPIPNVTCKISDGSAIKLTVISFCGIVFPNLFVLLYRPKKARTEIKFSLFLLEIISVLSLGINIVLSFLSLSGQSFMDDDIGIIFSKPIIPKAFVLIIFAVLFVLVIATSLGRKNYLVFKEM
jgi:membrane-associated protease RseP (regulator of RpoE activity)